MSKQEQVARYAQQQQAKQAQLQQQAAKALFALFKQQTVQAHA